MGNRSAIVLMVVGVASLVLWANNATVPDGRSVLKYIADGLAGGKIGGTPAGATGGAGGGNPAQISPVILPRFDPADPNNLPKLPLPGTGAGGLYTLYPVGSIWGFNA